MTGVWFGLVVFPATGSVWESLFQQLASSCREDLTKLQILYVGFCQLDRDFALVAYTSMQVYVGARM